MLPPDTFQGRIAVITGGGSGIGHAIAGELAALGATVILVGRRQQLLEEASRELTQQGASARGIAGDVRDPERIDAITKQVMADYGSIDVLVNSAAGNFRVSPEDMSINAWNAVVRIVLDGSWNWTQAVGRQAIAHDHGASILNIGTVGALLGGPETAHSASAKAGVVAMTKSLAGAWGQHGIRLNVLTPGITDNTPGAEILLKDPGMREKAIGEVPLGRAAVLSEMTHAASFLLRDYAAYITGANLVVDGGRSLGRA